MNIILNYTIVWEKMSVNNEFCEIKCFSIRTPWYSVWSILNDNLKWTFQETLGLLTIIANHNFILELNIQMLCKITIKGWSVDFMNITEGSRILLTWLFLSLLCRMPAINSASLLINHRNLYSTIKMPWEPCRQVSCFLSSQIKF